jgi:ABC-type molybdate transport system substrate-binding protein
MKCASAIVGLAFALATHVEAADKKVISTGGARAVMTSIVPEFEHKSGHKVGIDFGTPGKHAGQAASGRGR